MIPLWLFYAPKEGFLLFSGEFPTNVHPKLAVERFQIGSLQMPTTLRVESATRVVAIEMLQRIRSTMAVENSDGQFVIISGIDEDVLRTKTKNWAKYAPRELQPEQDDMIHFGIQKRYNAKIPEKRKLPLTFRKKHR